MSNENYYEVLGVSQTATAEEIKKSYKRLAMKYHPDRGTDDSDEEKFKIISEAYETLHKPEKRAVYDQVLKYGAAGPQAGSAGNPYSNERYTATDWGMFGEDIFNFFHGGVRGARQQQQQRNSSFMSDLQITLEEAFMGCQKTIVVTGNSYDKKTVAIPAGVNSGDRLKLHGCGSSKIEGLPPGDHILNIVVIDHHKFNRRGADLHVTISVGVFEAMFGLLIKLKHLDGQEIRFNLPSGTQPNQSIRLKGKGMPVINSTARGDLYVTVKVFIPKMDGNESDNLDQLAGARNAEISI